MKLHVSGKGGGKGGLVSVVEMLRGMLYSLGYLFCSLSVNFREIFFFCYDFYCF